MDAHLLCTVEVEDADKAPLRPKPAKLKVLDVFLPGSPHLKLPQNLTWLRLPPRSRPKMVQSLGRRQRSKAADLAQAAVFEDEVETSGFCEMHNHITNR